MAYQCLIEDRVHSVNISRIYLTLFELIGFKIQLDFNENCSTEDKAISPVDPEGLYLLLSFARWLIYSLCHVDLQFH